MVISRILQIQKQVNEEARKKEDHNRSSGRSLHHVLKAVHGSGNNTNRCLHNVPRIPAKTVLQKQAGIK